MIDLLRFLFAVAVVIAHLSGVRYCNHYGIYVVFGFYILSGYFTTLVVQKTYSLSFRGGLLFAANRFLRIYPTYIVLLLLGLVIIGIYGNSVTQYHASMKWPEQIYQWISNISIVLPPGESGSRVIPPSWVLSVQLRYYAFIYLFMGRTAGKAALCLAVALLYTIIIIVTDAPWTESFYPLTAALLPFSIGACLYFWKEQIHLRRSSAMLITAFSLFLLNLIAAPFIFEDPYSDIPFYLNTALVTFVIAIAIYPIISMKAKVKQFVTTLGQLSYPLFLSHFIIGFMIYYHMLPSARRSIELLLLTTPFVLGASYLLVVFVERPFEAVRASIRKKGSLFASESQRP